MPKNVFTDPEGTVRLVIPNNPLPAPPGIPSGAPAAAEAQADWVQEVFGARSVGDLVVDSVSPTDAGSTVRLRQEIDSIPVYGATVAQTLAADGSLVSASGELSQQTQGKYPAGATTPPAEVSATAVRTLAEQTKTPTDQFAVFATVAMWYDPKLADRDARADRDAAASVAVPGFKVELRRGGTAGQEPGTWVVFVDANNTGRVLDTWSDAERRDRVACDANRTRADIDSPRDPAVCGTPPGVRPTG
ncbi:hypothetical protein [Nocardia brasiliensis]|uniref:hypothetical protein n=1 Tax=Nocardia brasiliensis TaxID=37326 RepID=UPI00366AF6CF